MSEEPDLAQIIANQRAFTNAVVDLADTLNTALGMVSREAARLRLALVQIAAFGDEGGNAYLAATGSYAKFDEPSAVKIAREALAEQEQQPAQSPVPEGMMRAGVQAVKDRP